MPTNSAVREILPSKRLICASRYSRSNTSRASRSARVIRCSPPLPFGIAGIIEPTSCGSIEAVITASGSPPARIISRSTLLRSWRTLPGQSCDCSTASASAADIALGQAGGLRNLRHEIFDEFGNILAPLGEPRHADRHDRQPMIKILAEFAGGDVGLDVAAGRGDDAHVDRDLGAAADALEGLIDQHAQNLVLRLARHVGDLVDEQRAAVRLFERADLAALRAVAGFDAEQLDFHLLRHDGGGVDHDERPVGARRQRVEWCARQAPCRCPMARQ